jgi:hypothetical protein
MAVLAMATTANAGSIYTWLVMNAESSARKKRPWEINPRAFLSFKLSSAD